MEEIECRESHPQKMVRGAVDAPLRKTDNPQPKRTPSQDHHRNLRLNRHKAEIASFGSPQWGDPQKQAMPAAVYQETVEGRKQRSPKAH